MSDLAQWGVIDRWSAPLETFTTGRGDCEDYAIAKYVALTAAGVAAAGREARHRAQSRSQRGSRRRCRAPRRRLDHARQSLADAGRRQRDAAGRFRCSCSIRRGVRQLRRATAPCASAQRATRRRRPPRLRLLELRLLRLGFVDAVPIRRRRIGAVSLDALDIHVVEPGDIEAVGDLAAALDQIERLIPFLLADSAPASGR